MEKTYKILKMVALVLGFAAILLGAWVLYEKLGDMTQIGELVTQPTRSTEPVQQVPAEQSGQEEQPPQEKENPAAIAAPDFTVYDAEGNAHKLSDYLGKPVVLNFWASWCGPCKMEMPDFDEKYQEYGEEVQFLMVNLTDGYQETVDTASAFIRSQGYQFPVFYDTAVEGAAAYGVNSVPVTFFIDAEGYLQARGMGTLSAETLQKGIDMVLNP